MKPVKTRVTLLSALFLLAVPIVALALEMPQKSYRIGFLCPLSGSRASIGEDARNGASLALSDLQEQGLISEGQLEIVFEDHQGDPAKGVSAFNKLLALGVKYFITQNSNVSLPIAPLANANKVIQLAITTTSDRFSSAGDFTFRTNGSTLYEAKTLASFLKQRLTQTPGNLALLTMQDEYPVTLRQHLLDEFKQNNISATLDEEFLPQETDFRSLISKLKARRANYILCLGYQTQCGYFVKQQKEMALNPILILSNTPVNNREFFTAAGEAADGVMLSYPQPNLKHPAALRYQTRFGKSANLFSANAYDAVIIAQKSLAACHYEDDMDRIRKALYSIKNFDGMSGLKSFDDTYGDMQDSYTILTARNGKFE